jgi:DNA-directed RNA polymerase specialized sigma24 family protein
MSPPTQASDTADADPRYESAMSRLPPAYADVLRHTATGTPDREICLRLGIEPEGLDTLRDLAARKLRNLLT